VKSYNNLNAKNALVKLLHHITWYTTCSVVYLVKDAQKVRCKDCMKRKGVWRCNSTNC